MVPFPLILQNLINFSITMRYAFLLLFLSSLSAGAQAVRDINYGFLYEPSESFVLDINPVRSGNGWTVVYKFTVSDTARNVDEFLIKWDLRTSLSEKEGVNIDAGEIEVTRTRTGLEGIISLPVSPSPQLLVAKVLNNMVKRAWVAYKVLDPNYPVNAYLTTSEGVVGRPFLKSGTPLSIKGLDGQVTVSYYPDEFPAAVPPFAEEMGRVSRGMRVDTTYTVSTNQEVTFSETGLYLIQQDTSDTSGIAFRIEDDYPRFSRLESLADPLIYVCTKQEFDRVRAATGEKKAFDRMILNITGNAERARSFMRNYFKRVEWANYYFTSYKEGWKTDRGMIYILFGLPDQLFKFSDREVWKYDNASVKATFDFVKSSTVFDPENYVLVRDKKFREIWYEKIDLWRNARF
jgi:GWxTD domain-containing protein